MSQLTCLGFPRRISSICNPIKVTKNVVWRYGSCVSYEPHVFVIGAPRSGTTLMFTVLSSHPVFSAIDTETFLLVPRDIFNLENYSRLFDDDTGLSKQKIADLLKKSKDIIQLYDNIAKCITEKDGKRRFLEKTPFHVLYLQFLIKHFPNAKFINMIRDGRDCYVSNKRLPHRFHQPLEKFANLWRNSIRTRQKLGSHHQIIDIKYEEFTQEPLAVGKRIMDFIGEDFLEQQLDPAYYSNTKIFQGMSGHERLSQPVTPSSIGSWRKKMTDAEINIFNRIAGHELKELLYEI